MFKHPKFKTDYNLALNARKKRERERRRRRRREKKFMKKQNKSKNNEKSVLGCLKTDNNITQFCNPNQTECQPENTYIDIT